MVFPPSLQSRTVSRVVLADNAGGLRRRFLLFVALSAPLPLLAQMAGGGDGFLFSTPVISLTIRGGYDRPMAGGDLYKFATTQLTLSKSDFAAAGVQADIGFRLNPRTEFVLSGGSAVRETPSEFRRYIDNNDLPIQQTTRLRRLPISAGFRFALRSTGQRFGKFAFIPNRLTPWVGAGAGAIAYSFTQRGDFVDFKTLNVFNQSLGDKGWAPMGYVNVAADFGVSKRLFLNGDLRYTSSRARMAGDFVGFKNIDLSGTAATMGFSVRY